MPGAAVADLERMAADNVKRTWRGDETDFAPDPGTRRLLTFTETKTVWHPMGI